MYSWSPNVIKWPLHQYDKTRHHNEWMPFLHEVIHMLCIHWIRTNIISIAYRLGNSFTIKNQHDSGDTFTLVRRPGVYRRVLSCGTRHIRCHRYHCWRTIGRFYQVLPFEYPTWFCAAKHTKTFIICFILGHFYQKQLNILF